MLLENKNKDYDSLLERIANRYEQGGSSKAGYGKGFSLSNLKRMRQFYTVFPISAELPHKLSWTHFCELVKIDDPLERSFYQQQCLIEDWSITTILYLRN